MIKFRSVTSEIPRTNCYKVSSYGLVQGQTDVRIFNMENDEHSHEHFGNIINPLMREKNMCGTYLRLDKSEVSVGEDVLLTWNLPEFVTDYQDWIGMYEKGNSINHYCVIT